MITLKEIYAVLRGIDDPEMPVSIVDLGTVAAVRVAAAGSGTPGTSHVPMVAGGAAVEVDFLPTFVGCPAIEMITREIRERIRALDGVDDVRVRVLHDPPWTVDRISDAGRESLRAHGVTVPNRRAEPADSAGACGLSVGGSAGATGRAGAAAGSLVPLTISAAPESVSCPFCGSDRTHLDSPFGPTRCRMIYYCDACRNAFEHMKRV